MQIIYKPIGIVHSPFNELAGMPIQPAGAEGIQATIEIFPEFLEGLKDLDGFSHIILLCHFHQSQTFKLQVIPYLDTDVHGLFATRAPKRPNPIGLSVVKLNRVEQNVLHIENVDLLDGTPLLDLKPYVPDFDAPESIRIGWLEKFSPKVNRHRSDERFIDK